MSTNGKFVDKNMAKPYNIKYDIYMYAFISELGLIAPKQQKVLKSISQLPSRFSW